MKSDNPYDTSALDSIPRQIYRLLDTLGAPCHFQGYDVAAYSLSRILYDPGLLYNVSRNLYPMLSTVFNKSPSNIGQCLGNLVRYLFDNGDQDVLDRYFGSQIKRGKSRVTTTQFLNILYRVLLRESLEI